MAGSFFQGAQNEGEKSGFGVTPCPSQARDAKGKWNPNCKCRVLCPWALPAGREQRRSAPSRQVPGRGGAGVARKQDSPRPELQDPGAAPDSAGRERVLSGWARCPVPTCAGAPPFSVLPQPCCTGGPYLGAPGTVTIQPLRPVAQHRAGTGAGSALRVSNVELTRYTSKFRSVSISCVPTVCGILDPFIPLMGGQPARICFLFLQELPLALPGGSCLLRPGYKWYFPEPLPHRVLDSPVRPPLGLVEATWRGRSATGQQVLGQGFLGAQMQGKCAQSGLEPGIWPGLWGATGYLGQGETWSTQLLRSSVFLKDLEDSPGCCGSVDGAPACEPKGGRFDSQSGHTP